MKKYTICICGGTGCLSSASEEVKKALLNKLKEQGMADRVKVKETGCMGTCDLGPVILIEPDGIYYCQLKPADIDEIITKHLQEGVVVERLVFGYNQEKPISQHDQIPFFQGQNKIALRNTGKIDPLEIDDYLNNKGYQALEKVVSEMSPEEVVEIIKDSALRGRGGGGFPTGLKWQLTAKAESAQKYVVCNADEGDPGAFMDRSILEGDPHSIIEAMAIAAYAIGANQGYVYVRAEYPLAVERLDKAINDAKNSSYLGENLFNSGFNFDLEIRVGAGAFVCGEETALMASIEGDRGEPKPKPPFPAESGLWGKPTLINNVETFANIPAIILQGASWFKEIGTEKSSGTKVFAVAGDINATGLVEVAMGTTLRQIIYDICGGIPEGKKFKAAQTGGPSGGCIPEEYLDISMDYDSLIGIGSMMGSGGLIVMDEDTCMVDVARFFLDFTQDESCGKCVPCRIGTKRMLEILERITKGEGQTGDMKKLLKLGEYIKENSLCGLGQTAPNPVLSTIKYFKDEYIAHIKEKSCPAGSCRNLTSYKIVAEDCRNCGLCVKACPTDAIKKGDKSYFIEKDKCVKCGECYDKCPFNAIEKGV